MTGTATRVYTLRSSRVAAVGIMLLAAITCGTATDQPPAGSGNLESVWETVLVVEYLAPEGARDVGLSPEMLRGMLEEALVRSARVPLVDESPGNRHVLLRVGVLPLAQSAHCVYDVRLSLRESVDVDRGTHTVSVAGAETWRAEYAMGMAPDEDIVEAVGESIERQVDQSTLCWMRDNPR